MIILFFEYDLTEEQQEEWQNLVDKELIRRRQVISSFNEVIGLKDMWIELQKKKGKFFPK
jgi:regulator of sigma D